MNYRDLPMRLASVRQLVERACDRAGRRADEVSIVAVTKTHPPEAIEAVLAAGVRDIGENRVQELEGKVERLGRRAARWHLIGHLQRNKVRRAIELADVIHSVDSVRLARRISEDAELGERTVEVLIQVNVSGEETKGGIESAAALDQIREICELPGLRVSGLMTMAPFAAEAAEIRSVFAATRKLRDEALAAVPGFDGSELSMGMSGDFEIAIEEGSTLVRLGTILLGERGA